MEGLLWNDKGVDRCARVHDAGVPCMLVLMDVAEFKMLTLPA